MNIGAVVETRALSISTLKGRNKPVPGNSHMPPALSRECSELLSGHYQLALVSMGTRSPEDKNATRKATVVNLLLLPSSWKNLLSRIYSDATQIQSEPSDHLWQFGDARIDLLRYDVRRANQSVELTTLEFKLLKFFLFNPNRVISREEFLEMVWGYDCYPVTRTVDNHILRLRQKLEPDPTYPVHFQTVHGVGYKFVP